MKKEKTKPEKKYNNVSEEELLSTIDIISKKLAYKFRFGYHEIEDMKQQISIFALEGMANYDHNRPLENFLWTHVRNRLFNTKETITKDQKNHALLVLCLIKNAQIQIITV